MTAKNGTALKRVAFLFLLFVLLAAGEQFTLRRFDYVYQGKAFLPFVNAVNAATVLLIGEFAVPFLRRLLNWLLAVGLLFLFFSGLWTFAVDRNSIFAFQMTIWHSTAGVGVTPIFIAYLFYHFYEWAGRAQTRDLTAGLLALFIVGSAMWSGAIFAAIGSHPLLGVLAFHKYSSLAIAPLLWLHARLSKRRAEEGAGRFSLCGAFVPMRSGAAALAATAAIVLFLLAAAMGWIRTPERFFPGVGKKAHYAEAPAAGGSAPGGGLFLPSLANTVEGRPIPPEYLQSSRACAGPGCHQSVFDQWDASGHRHSMNAYVMRAAGLFQKDYGVEGARYCAGCHDPVSLLSGRLIQGCAPVPPEENEGISCIVCHTIVKVNAERGNAAYTLDITKNFFERETRQNNYMMNLLYLDDHKKTFNRDLYKKDEYCGACHTHEIPEKFGGRNSPLQALHSMESMPKSDLTCNGCHMPKIRDAFKMTRIDRSHRFLSFCVRSESYRGLFDEASGVGEVWPDCPEDSLPFHGGKEGLN